MKRRAFLTNTALLAALPAGAWGAQHAPYAREAQRLTDLTQKTFWDPQARMYRALVRSADSVDSDGLHDRGYVFWPSIEMFRALAEGEGVRRGAYRETLRRVFDGIEQYYDPEKHAYNAWLMFPGNNDKYYDDNSLAAIALVRAFEHTGDVRYRNRAQALMRDFIRGGWDDTGRPGGMRWGTDTRNRATSDRAACATSQAALAALALARVGVDRAENVAWARPLLEWLKTHLQDKDGLIMDALVPPDWKVRDVKWTYNTGVTLSAWVALHRLTGEDGALAEARRLADAALDRGGRMYDGLVKDPERNHFYDSGFFVPYLVEGLLALHRVTRERRLLNEAWRNADFAYKYLRDPADGLYWRNWRLWRIGEAQWQAWQKLMGRTGPYEPDGDERSKEHRYDNTPVRDRPLVKTLLGNAGTARLFWMVAAAGDGGI